MYTWHLYQCQCLLLHGRDLCDNWIVNTQVSSWCIDFDREVKEVEMFCDLGCVWYWLVICIECDLGTNLLLCLCLNDTFINRKKVTLLMLLCKVCKHGAQVVISCSLLSVAFTKIVNSVTYCCFWYQAKIWYWL